jgi:hypothetical protein
VIATTIKSRRVGHVVRIDAELSLYAHYPSGSEADCIRGALQIHDAIAAALTRDPEAVTLTDAMEAGRRVFVHGEHVAAWVRR